MKHKCENIVIHCMDFRLIEKTNSFLKENYGTENYDLISVAGSSKVIAEGNGDYLLKQIEISHNLHDSKRVILIHHSDCGAYQIQDKDQEKTKQFEDMEKSESAIKRMFPDMEVDKIWAEILEDNIIFNKI
ncbi:MAG: hypothetical protein PHV25_01005 [Candidatus Pacebacteria bacterium]|nr:hypothetical protein [Candidatus Paceibacterota bacterium]